MYIHSVPYGDVRDTFTDFLDDSGGVGPQGDWVFRDEQVKILDLPFYRVECGGMNLDEDLAWFGLLDVFGMYGKFSMRFKEDEGLLPGRHEGDKFM